MSENESMAESDKVNRTPGPARYVITYYGYGMTPKYKDMDNLADAVAEFESMAADPHAGASSLELRQTIMRAK